MGLSIVQFCRIIDKVLNLSEKHLTFFIVLRNAKIELRYTQPLVFEGFLIFPKEGYFSPLRVVTLNHYVKLICLIDSFAFVVVVIYKLYFFFTFASMVMYSNVHTYIRPFTEMIYILPIYWTVYVMTDNSYWLTRERIFVLKEKLFFRIHKSFREYILLNWTFARIRHTPMDWLEYMNISEFKNYYR